MKILGLDIGTTTVSAAVMEDGRLLESRTENNGLFLPSESWAKIQDPLKIRSVTLAIVEQLFDAHPDISRIGITGQMHGIVYLDAQGEPVSPLYTWQDGRGDLPCSEKESYAAFLSRLTGYPLSTGYGLVTHYYNKKNGIMPDNAVVFCTIHDYIAMVLSGRKSPVTDASDAASFGLFDVEKGCFDLTAIAKAGIDGSMLPPLTDGSALGSFRGAKVYAAIGDNQASFLGAAAGELDTMLVNVGTGSQFSVYSPVYLQCEGLETRPFPLGGYLIVGASLCGGRAYALLESFFREICAGGSQYDAMDALLSQGRPEDLPTVSPLFQGTRQNPGLRGAVTGISTENFTPRHLCWAFLEGMAQELYDMYLCYRRSGGREAKLIGSGNGLRKNRHLRSCFARLFGQTPQMSELTEEAAAGAAIFAAMQN